MPDAKWHRHQDRFHARCAGYRSEEFFVRIHSWPAALDGQRSPLRPLHHPRNRLRDVLHIGWLQPRLAPAEHRINGKATQQLDEGVEKRIIRAEHHGRSDHGCAGKGRADRLLSLASRADVG